jgi:hypothetical protein
MPRPNRGVATLGAPSDHLIGAIIALSNRMPASNGRTTQLFQSCQANSEFAAGRSVVVVYAALWCDLLIDPVKGIGTQSALGQVLLPPTAAAPRQPLWLPELPGA